jgi:hypothetical protein
MAAACDIVPSLAPGPTHVDGTENQPGPGLVVVAGDPPKATAPLIIQFVGHEGNVVEERTSRIATGGVIEASTFSLPGVMRLQVNGTACDGDFAIVSNLRTNVILRVDEDGCSIQVTTVEPL